MVVLGLRLDLMILEGFSNLHDSRIFSTLPPLATNRHVVLSPDVP